LVGLPIYFIANPAKEGHAHCCARLPAPSWGTPLRITPPPQAAPQHRLGEGAPPPMCAAFAPPLQKPLAAPRYFMPPGMANSERSFSMYDFLLNERYPVAAGSRSVREVTALTVTLWGTMPWYFSGGRISPSP